jgi:hypothetical protein
MWENSFFYFVLKNFLLQFDERQVWLLRRGNTWIKYSYESTNGTDRYFVIQYNFKLFFPFKLRWQSWGSIPLLWWIWWQVLHRNEPSVKKTSKRTNILSYLVLSKNFRFADNGIGIGTWSKSANFQNQYNIVILEDPGETASSKKRELKNLVTRSL